ncbi:amidohydrolase family protein [uncultured Roseobacter sp.]|uniref:amidohydrolase family protein n=1 Tax=uncultured Roseobacter sp. TaxID=114847 RepID=UPI002635BE6C|nr:amidohydrolase family protein [uncultured Roseobacter sp.]
MIDAHHHIWLQQDLPWLMGPEQPRIFGPYRAIMRDYTTREFLADLAGTGITKSVYVQANWAPDRFEDEVAWVQAQAEAHGTIEGIVGYADFTGDDVRPQLDRLRKYPLMRGIRQQFHWHENPLYRFAQDPDLCRNPAVQRNVARLADYGWSFDLQVFAGQMAGAAELAQACPGVTFILQHAGMKEDTSDAGHELWTEGMKRLAACPNVVSKLSAFGTFIHRNDRAFIAQMVPDTVAIFGADRCLYGSNYPIEKLWTSYLELFNAFQDATRDLPDAQRSAIFHDTAARVYRL